MDSLIPVFSLQNRVNCGFTLQNGEEKLRIVFSDIRRFMYEDSLAVTNVEDIEIDRKGEGQFAVQSANA